MPSILTRRCPGIITDKGSENKGKSLDGCWVNLQMVDVKLYRAGNITCPHCGDNAVEVPKKMEKESPPDGLVGLKVWIKRIKTDEFIPRIDDVACCHNVECSRAYLPEDGQGSDAVIMDRHRHSGTQYIWKKPHADSLDTWEFSEDRGDNDESLDPRNDEKGKSWRRCIFCGSLMKHMHSRLSLKRMVYRNPSEHDSGFNFAGPAATFRIYREADWAELQRTPRTPELVKV